MIFHSHSSVSKSDVLFACLFCPTTDPSECILRSMQRSRRLLFVLSPDFLAEKSFSLFECRLGLYLDHSAKTNIIAVGYRSVSKLPCVEVAQIRKAASATITWRGKRSESPRSRFWLRVRLALPGRPLALGRRMIDSTSSHSDLAAFMLQKHYTNKEQHNHRKAQRKSIGNQSRGSGRASTNPSLRRDRQVVVTEARKRCSGWVEVENQEVRSVDEREQTVFTEQANQVDCGASNPSPLRDITDNTVQQNEAMPAPANQTDLSADLIEERSCDRDEDEFCDQSEEKPTLGHPPVPSNVSNLANGECSNPPGPASFPDLLETNQAVLITGSAHDHNRILSSKSSCAIITNLPQSLNCKDPDATLSSDSAPFTDSAHSECQQEVEETRQTNTVA
ncbi:unnamed protein product [Knipowitschia caucasica]